jgi:predicted DNA-binding transcriptional regulator AlpA
MQSPEREDGARGGEGPWYRLDDMCRLFDVGERCIWTWVANGRLPKPRRVGRRWSRWPRAEIDTLLAKWGKAG